MSTKSQMQEEVEKSEQLDLIDVRPKNAAELVKVAKEYNVVKAKRMKLTEKEVELKQKVLKLLEEGNVQRLEGGKRKLKIERIKIETEPSGEKVRITEVYE